MVWYSPDQRDRQDRGYIVDIPYIQLNLSSMDGAAVIEKFCAL